MLAWQVSAARDDGAQGLRRLPARYALVDQVVRHARRQRIGPHRAGTMQDDVCLGAQLKKEAMVDC